jgi:H+/Cl- antiporter ClcA
LEFSLGSYRRSLTRYESALAYALLGIIAGVLSGVVVIGFEHSIEQLALLWGVGDRGDDFEALPALWRFLLPVCGALGLGLAFSFLSAEDREVGIVHVISRLHSNYGMLPWRNAVVQFIGGAVALATGQSGGREGPGVHLGGAVNSVVGQRLSLPNNSLRVLIACGSAGGIAAAFNTPLAGVIFAMEVIVSEYTVAGFLPVLLAAVAASALSRSFGGGSEIFDLSSAQLGSLWEIPYVVVLGICCGTAAAMLIRISVLSAGLAHWPVIVRFGLAGLLVGSFGLVIPEVLGIGYDTLERAMYGELALGALLLIATAKILATGVTVGLGMPVGLIGPILLVGACIGGALGIAAPSVYAQLLEAPPAIDPIFYVTIGMAATMGAVFAAPLAAGLAAIELTQSTSIAMPALLAIVAATLTNQALFRQRAAHISVLRQLQRQLPGDPLNQLLHRTDVNSVLDSSVVIINEQVSPAVNATLTLQIPNWCLISRDGEDLFLVRGGELIEWLEADRARADDPAGDADSSPTAGIGSGHALNPTDGADSGDSGGDEERAPPLVTESTLRRWTIAAVPEQATLRQALDILRARTVEAVCVYGRVGRGKRVLRGIVTRDRIERFTLDRMNS